MNTIKRIAVSTIGLLIFAPQIRLPAQSPPGLVQQIAEIIIQAPSGNAHQRFIHAKGIVCQGTFDASPNAAVISRATHLSGAAVPVTVRFSDGAPDSAVADSSPGAAPRGMAIRFGTGRGTDILAISHNGFLVGTGEGFLALQKAIVATDASKPHPWPVDGSVVWPDDRKKVELGVMTISSVVPDSGTAERALAFDPTRLADGIELSDDALSALRSRVYVYSVAGRTGNNR